MKELTAIEDSLTNRISYYHIIAFMLCQPFDRFYSELILFSFLAHELIHLNRSKLASIKLPVLLPALLYFVTILGCLYSSDKTQMFKDLEKQLALVLFPIIFSLTSLDLNKYLPRLLKAFALIILATILYLYFDAFRIIRFNKLPLSTLFTPAFINHNFSLSINLHATYLSMYVAVAFVVFLQLFIDTPKTINKLFYSVAILVLALGIFQLSSKAVFIAMLVIINIAVPFLARTKKTRWKPIVVSAALTLIAVIGLTKNEEFKTRFIQGFEHDLKRASSNVNELEPRMVRWRCAIQLIKQAPVIGHGSGSETNLLKEAYYNNRLFLSYLNELNAHNEYLSFFIKTGIIGLAVFLYVLFYGFKQAVQRRDFIFCSFMIVIAVVSISENILDVNKGIFFFAFFYPMFMKS